MLAGKPTFGTLIALLHKGVPVLGIIDQPISRERWVGVAGELTTLNGAQAWLCTQPDWQWLSWRRAQVR